MKVVWRLMSKHGTVHGMTQELSLLGKCIHSYMLSDCQGRTEERNFWPCHTLLYTTLITSHHIMANRIAIWKTRNVIPTDVIPIKYI